MSAPVPLPAGPDGASGDAPEEAPGAGLGEHPGDLPANGFERRLAELVLAAERAGALAELRAPLERAARAAADAADAARPHDLAAPPPMRFGMVGDSPKMRKVFDLIERIAKSDVAVLVLGETGTGKELVARALHEHSPRKHKPFLAENCAAVPAELLESELFGHKRGSFTGAVVDRAGHFVAANGGVVFLDEIGDMPLRMQAKLLRVLQEGEVRPVGSNQVTKVDVRIVAATNKDLRAMCAQGTFREDLYFRLNVISIHLPPLRERPGDVAHLVRFQSAAVGREMGVRVTVDADALAALEAWRWPGNVRELENEIRRAVALTGGHVTKSALSPHIQVAS